MLCFSATEVVGQFAMYSIGIYSGQPSSTSSCISVGVPETHMVGQALKLNVSASRGTINALAYDPAASRMIFHLSICGLRSLKFNYNPTLPRGIYQMTVIDWTNDPSCSIQVEHDLIVFKAQGQLSVSCTIRLNPDIILGSIVICI